MSKKKKTIIIIIIATVVVIAAVLFFVLGSSNKGESNAVVQLVRDVISAPVSNNRYNGVVETQKTQVIKLEGEKTVAKVYVKEGDTVKTGEKLFSYDTQKDELDIRKIEIEIDLCRSTIESDRQEIAELEKQLNQATGADVLEITAQIKENNVDISEQEYNIKTKEAEISSKKAEIKNSTVTSNIDGTVQTINDPNEIIQNAELADGSANDEYMTIIAKGNLRVKGTVSEQNIMSLSKDAPVIIRSRLDDTKTWAGIITAINTRKTESTENEDDYYYGSSGESASKYPFYVDLDNVDGLILGQHVTIELAEGDETEKEGIWINSGWIVFEDDQTYMLVSETEDGNVEQRTVVLGEYDELTDQYEIKEGLTEDEYIAWPDEGTDEEGSGDDEDMYDDSIDMEVGDGDYDEAAAGLTDAEVE